jgi:plastocyanin
MRRVLIAALVLSTLLLAAPPASAATVSIADFSFSPTQVSVAQGGTVSWHNGGSATHTSTQNSPLSLWNTGNLTSGATSTAVTLRAAGSYPYHCAIHSFMTGTVKVPIKVSPATGTTSTTFTITLTSATQTGSTYDVQMKKGSGSFTLWKSGVTTRTVTFKGSAGMYSFRSRLHRTSNGATSGYSPAKTITIS